MLNVPAATPPGALDLTGDAARRRRALQRAAVGVLEGAGYEELLPPTFEYEDTFLRAGGTGVAERLLRFPDRDGRVLALRYDFTSSIARIAATGAHRIVFRDGLPVARQSAGDIEFLQALSNEEGWQVRNLFARRRNPAGYFRGSARPV